MNKEVVENKIMYHFHRINDATEWNVGQTIHTDDIEYNDFFSKSIDFWPWLADEDKDLVTLLTEALEHPKEIEEERISFLLERSISAIHEYELLTRELALEQVRKEYYPDLPSRKNCIWLCEESQIPFWNQCFSNHRGQLFKVKISGELFTSSDQFLPNLVSPYSYKEQQAHVYWNPTWNKDAKEQKEFLFCGRMELIEQLVIEEDKIIKSSNR